MLGEWQFTQSQGSIFIEDYEWEVELEEVLGLKWNTELNQEEWQDKLYCDATWEEAEFIQKQFPSFHLEDKVSVNLGGIVRPPIIHKFERKGKNGKIE